MTIIYFGVESRSIPEFQESHGLQNLAEILANF